MPKTAKSASNAPTAAKSHPYAINTSTKSSRTPQATIDLTEIVETKHHRLEHEIIDVDELIVTESSRSTKRRLTQLIVIDSDAETSSETEKRSISADEQLAREIAEEDRRQMELISKDDTVATDSLIDPYGVTLTRKTAAISDEATEEDKGEGSSKNIDALWESYLDDSKDILFAKELEEQEKREYQEFMNGLETKEDGIVFSVVVNAADGTLEDGSPAHPDDLDRFEPWRKLVEQSAGMKVKRFHWFVNYELEKRFEHAKDTLELLTGKAAPEMQLFHGTSAPNIDAILKGGFKIGGMEGHPMSHGAALGHGIYLATQAATSVGYAMGTNKIFACRVIPGRITNDARFSSRLPRGVDVGEEAYESYSSGGGVYVVRYKSLVLPCYMIEYEYQYQQLYPGLALPFPNFGIPNLGIPNLGVPNLGIPFPGAVPPYPNVINPFIPVNPAIVALPAKRKRAAPSTRAPRKKVAPVLDSNAVKKPSTRSRTESKRKGKAAAK